MPSKNPNPLDTLDGFLRALSRNSKTVSDTYGEYNKVVNNLKYTYQTPTLESSVRGIYDGFRNIWTALQGKKGPPDANDYVRANAMTAPPSGPGIVRR